MNIQSKAAVFLSAYLGVAQASYHNHGGSDQWGSQSNQWGWQNNAPDTPQPTLQPTQWPTRSPTPPPPTAEPSSSPTEDVSVELDSSPSCPETLNDFIYIDYSATLAYAIVPSNPAGANNGLLCGRLEAINDGWIGLAVSPDRSMAGAEAIIGVPGNDSVLKYDLHQYGVTEMTGEKQTLRDTAIYQEDDKTVMEFTKLLFEDDHVPILEAGINTFLHARGGSSLGFHGNGYLFFNKDFADEQGVKIEVTDESSTESSASDDTDLDADPDVVPSPAMTPGLDFQDCSSDFCEFELDADYLLRYRLNVADETVSMELIHEGEAWVAIAFSEDGKMVGSEAIIGVPADGTVLKYNLGSKSNAGVVPMPETQQTLLDASIEVEDGQTIMRFTKVLNESGEIPILAADNNILGAYGSDTALGLHSKRHSVVLNLSSGAAEEVKTPNKAVWLVHGIGAFLAWGVLVPFAVQSSILRRILPKGSVWFKVHRAFNATAYALTVVIFGIAVATVNSEGGSHFETNHAKMGLFMFIAVSAQVVSGALRPHLPAPDSNEEKTKTRNAWEIGHRVFGCALLACAFWQMGAGIELYAQKYLDGDSGSVGKVYSVWIAVMAAAVIVGGVYFKILKAPTKKESEESSSADTKDDSKHADV